MVGLLLSAVFVRDTAVFVRSEMRGFDRSIPAPRTWSRVFVEVSVADRNLSACSQAGLVNNLNDAVAWGLFPLLFASAGASVARIGALAAIYPAVWGLLQIGGGALSDLWGRKWPIAAGLWIQALGIWLVAAGSRFTEPLGAWVTGSVLLGIGTALVYPALLAAIGDRADPRWRASAVGVYRFWRDLGYAIGAVVSGILGDAFGLTA